MRMLMIAGALQLALLCPALACEGQKGAVIFEDGFQDDSGGWDFSASGKLKDSEFVISTGGKGWGNAVENLTFNVTDGDYCVELVLPPKPRPDALGQAGLVFWATDYNNFFLAEIKADNISLYKKQNGNWSTLFTQSNDGGIVKTEAGALNNIRVIVKNGLITMLVNGKELKKLRAQVPQGALRFGMHAGINTPSDDLLPADIDFHFKSVKVTAGQ